jgi:hypothetical protein
VRREPEDTLRRFTSGFGETPARPREVVVPQAYPAEPHGSAAPPAPPAAEAPSAAPGPSSANDTDLDIEDDVIRELARSLRPQRK